MFNNPEEGEIKIEEDNMLEDAQPKKTDLQNIGEFGLIEMISKQVEIKQESTVLGIGDDAAVIQYEADDCTVVSTDLLVEGVHFDLSYCPLKHLGYKAVVVNLSDIYAMNATPQQITVSIALSNRFGLEAINELYAGIHLACKNYQVDLIGGDTTSSRSGLVISVTAIGKSKKDKIVKRSGAKENNLLVVSGDLGGAYMGLQILEREKRIFLDAPQVQPDLEGSDYVLERQLKPEARADVVIELEKLGIVPTAMMDISDGLSSEILHLCKQSNLGVDVYEDKIPLDQLTYDKAREFNLDPTICALNGGEDYELLFAIDIKDFENIKNHPMFTIIGHFTDQNSPKQLVAKDGSRHDLIAQGWKSF
jgi:thiamine-monophosphate kinase